MCASPINDQGLKSKPCDGTLQASMHRFGQPAPERPMCAISGRLDCLAIS
jgi:hypothetical protein